MMMLEIDWGSEVSFIGRKSGRFIVKHKEFFKMWLICSIIFLPIFNGTIYLYKEFGVRALAIPVAFLFIILLGIAVYYSDDDYI